MEIPENPEWDNFKVPILANVRKGDHFTLYIGRDNPDRGLTGTKWGNPFKLKNESERLSILKQHKEWLEDQEDLIAALPELSGHVLGCWCFTGKLEGEKWVGHGKACHGQNLIMAYIKYVKNSV